MAQDHGSHVPKKIHSSPLVFLVLLGLTKHDKSVIINQGQQLIVQTKKASTTPTAICIIARVVDNTLFFTTTTIFGSTLETRQVSCAFDVVVRIPSLYMIPLR